MKHLPIFVQVVKGHVAAREDFESDQDYRNVLNKVAGLDLSC